MPVGVMTGASNLDHVAKGCPFLTLLLIYVLGETFRDHAASCFSSIPHPLMSVPIGEPAATIPL